MIVIGHRGARHEAPENTLPGFRYASTIGVRWVEYDVRLTADEQLVVIHDSTVDRTTDGTGPVAEQTLAQLMALDARAQFNDWPDDCRIPTFAEVLDATAGFEFAEVEIKHDEPERLEVLVPKVVDEIRAQAAAERVVLTSFDETALRIATDVAPDLPRSYIGDWADVGSVDTALGLGCVQAGLQYATTSADVVAAAKKAGLRVVGWPCNSTDDYDTMADWGCDAVTSDCPTAMLAHASSAG